MKNSSQNNSVLSSIIFLIFVLSFQHAFAASVLSTTKLGKSVNELGKQIESVSVRCSGSNSASRLIFSEIGNREWCSGDLPDLCRSTKLAVANDVCAYKFADRLEEYKNSQNQLSTSNVNPPKTIDNSSQVDSNNVPSAEIRNNEVALEKERIKLEREKLMLRRQELELNKRRLELERQSSSNN